MDAEDKLSVEIVDLGIKNINDLSDIVLVGRVVGMITEV